MFDPPPLALSLSGLSREEGRAWSGPPRAVLAWAGEVAHGAGVRSLVLDATRAGFRGRELDRGARRDLASGLRRMELGFAGLDLFVPGKDFTRPETVQRAVDAVLDAISLAADLAEDLRGRVVGVDLPPGLGADVRGTIEDAATGAGVRIADYGRAEPGDARDAPIGLGLDPVRAIERGESPGKLAARAGGALVAARLADRDGSGRCAVGDGELDVTGYAASLATVGVGAVAIDLRGLPEIGRAVRAATQAWAEVFRTPG
ncbi:MAG: hypothetical protein ACF8Q5_15005 [Phycisphaerales bacterium JB040]